MPVHSPNVDLDSLHAPGRGVDSIERVESIGWPRRRPRQEGREPYSRIVEKVSEAFGSNRFSWRPPPRPLNPCRFVPRAKHGAWIVRRAFRAPTPVCPSDIRPARADTRPARMNISPMRGRLVPDRRTPSLHTRLNMRSHSPYKQIHSPRVRTSSPRVQTSSPHVRICGPHLRTYGLYVRTHDT
jgi:hypothetical protein